MKPLLIGLTGGIGVGKSSVAAMMTDKGAKVVSGDKLGRIALEDSSDALAEVRGRFGNSVFSADGKLLRSELGKQVFASRDNVRWLTNLTFPRIHELWLNEVSATRGSVIVFDAALIVEWGIEHEFDFLAVVTSDREISFARLAQSRRMTVEQAKARQSMQADSSRLRAVADVVITNNGSRDNLQQQVDDFWNNTVEPELQRRRDQDHARSE